MTRSQTRSNDLPKLEGNVDIMGLTALGEASTGEKVALGLMAAGGVALLGGLTYYILSTRRSRNLAGTMLGQVVEKVNAGGMTLTHHRDPKMPIEKRIKILQDLTWQGVRDPRARKIALDMTKSCPERDGMCETHAVYKAIKGRVRYTGDIAPVKMGANGPIEGIDLYQTAYRTWEIGGGDCDDQAVLAATALALNGIQSKFRVTAPRKNAEYSHIYVLAGLPKLNPTKWVPLDATLPGDTHFGYEVPFGRNADFPV